MKAHAFTWLLAAALLAPSCFRPGHDTPACPAGAERCACYGNATCNPGLECRSGLCVGAPGLGADASTDPGGAACLACGQTICPSQAQACQRASGCAEVVRCWQGCGSSSTCTSGCSAGLSSETLAAVSQFAGCALLQCADACTHTAGAGTGGNRGPGGSGGAPGTGGAPGSGGVFGGACPTAGVHDGACASATARVCTGGIWQAEECAGCGVLNGAMFCGHIDAFVLDSTFVAQPANVVSLQQTASSVSATFNFTAVGQVGYIQFRFAYPLRAVSLSVYGETSPSSFAMTAVDASLENTDGSAGCDYTVTNNGLLYKGCWGGFLPADGLSNPPSSPASVFNLRLHGATAAPAGLVSMTVTQLNVGQ